MRARKSTPFAGAPATRPAYLPESVQRERARRGRARRAFGEADAPYSWRPIDDHTRVAAAVRDVRRLLTACDDVDLGVVEQPIGQSRRGSVHVWSTCAASAAGVRRRSGSVSALPGRTLSSTRRARASTRSSAAGSTSEPGPSWSSRIGAAAASSTAVVGSEDRERSTHDRARERRPRLRRVRVPRRTRTLESARGPQSESSAGCSVSAAAIDTSGISKPGQAERPDERNGDEEQERETDRDRDAREDDGATGGRHRPDDRLLSRPVLP